MYALKSAQRLSRAVRVEWEDGLTAQFTYVWLRDNGYKRPSLLHLDLHAKPEVGLPCFLIPRKYFYGCSSPSHSCLKVIRSCGFRFTSFYRGEPYDLKKENNSDEQGKNRAWVNKEVKKVLKGKTLESNSHLLIYLLGGEEHRRKSIRCMATFPSSSVFFPISPRTCLCQTKKHRLPS